MPELSRRRKQLVLAICCMSLFIVGLDSTIVNLALPSIRTEFGASVSQLQWTIDAYTLVLASLLMLAGSTGDRIGRRRTFQTGLVLFTMGSLLCSVAPNVGLLVVFRMVQAVGGSMLNPVAMSIITNTFTDPRDRAKAIGVWGGVIGLSMALGPLVGGALVDSVGWRSIFWINVPFGVAAVVLAALFVPESRAPRARRLDPVGQLLVIVLLASVTFGIIEGAEAGWGSPLIVGSFVLAAAALVGLVRYEPRRTDPLLDLRFFRSIPFAGATVMAVAGFAAMGGFMFLTALYLQDVRGFSALHAGLLTLPMAGMTAVLAPIAGRIVAARGARLPLVVAGVFLIASALVLTTLRVDTPIGVIIAAFAMFGVGFGLLNAPITNAAVSGMPRAQAGVAAAVASTSRQVGGALGVAVLGAVVTGAVVTGGATGALGVGFTEASHVGWWIMAGCGVVVLAVGFVSTGAWARRTADTAAELFEAEAPRPVAAAR
ncbi:DHA2 family efflux MFS transporter permease subunit [Pseudonocardia sp. GCM10023141]|uniref:DHA2 family efflux MFS transporter permease subunit n=1 Tax=Pseudonocardia sp. GCM10023141 TaxID=3252653 RepID=UPI003605FBCB